MEERHFVLLFVIALFTGALRYRAQLGLLEEGVRCSGGWRVASSGRPDPPATQEAAAGGRPSALLLLREAMRGILARRRWRLPDGAAAVPVRALEGLTPSFRSALEAEMAALGELSCVGFRRRVAGEPGPYVDFVGRGGDCHDVAVDDDGVVVAVGLNPDCADSGTAARALMGALGLGDPDDLQEEPEGRMMALGLPRDRRTVRRRPPAGGRRRRALSRGDVASVNRLYECRGHYLGDDIPDAVPYDEFYEMYMKEDDDDDDAYHPQTSRR